MPDFGSFRGFSEKLAQGQTPTQLGTVGSLNVSPPLLDAFPNAYVAYSTRKLRLAYTGSAIRVRRSSDNTESDIGFNALGNLDTTTLTSFCGAGNGFVTTWYDQSGNGYNATQTTAANQPQIVSSGNLITQNGKPTLSFDGTNDFFVNTTTINYTDFSAFLVNKYNTLSSASVMFQYSKLDLALVNNTLQSSDTGVATITSYTFNDVGTILTRLHTHISTVATGITTSTLFLNGTQKATGSRTLSSSKTTLSISADNNGSIPAGINQQEIILYASSQASNRVSIESNINTYYGIY